MGVFAPVGTRRPPPFRNSKPQGAQRIRERTVLVEAAASGGPCSRRGAVAGLLLPALALQLGGAARVSAEEAAAAGSSTLLDAQASAEAVREVAEPRWRDYIAREFSFSYPPTLKAIEEDIFQDIGPSAPRSTMDRVVENPVKAQLVSGDGLQRVSVVVRYASTIKPTAFQITDISQWGTARDVAKLLLPPGAVVSSYESISIPQPPKETGTIFGAIQRDPVTLFRYEVVLPDQTQVAMSVGAQKGQVYVLGASASQSQWQQAGDALRRVAETFRLVMR